MRSSLSDRSPSVDFGEPAHRAFRALAGAPDFRKARGRRFDISVLAPIVLGLAAGHRSFAGIAAFGRRGEDDLIPMLGLPRAPSHKTVWRIAKGVPPEAVREAPREATAGLWDMAVSVDGKGMAGSRNEAGGPANVVTAVEHCMGTPTSPASLRRWRRSGASRRTRPAGPPTRPPAP